MQTIIAAIVLFAIAMTALAVGVIFGRAPVKGSCGGIACAGGCGACPQRQEDAP